MNSYRIEFMKSWNPPETCIWTDIPFIHYDIGVNMIILTRSNKFTYSEYYTVSFEIRDKGGMNISGSKWATNGVISTILFAFG